MNPQNYCKEYYDKKNWSFHVPDFNAVYKINNFGDIDKKYFALPNRWCIYGNSQGNVAIVNEKVRDITIDNIPFRILHKKNLPQPFNNAQIHD